MQRSILVVRLTLNGPIQTTISFVDVAFDTETKTLSAGTSNFVLNGEISQAGFSGTLGARGYNDYRIKLELAQTPQLGDPQARTPGAGSTAPLYKSLRLEGEGSWKNIGAFPKAVLDLHVFGATGEDRLLAFLTPIKVLPAKLIARLGVTELVFKNAEWNQVRGRLVGTHVLDSRVFTLDCFETRTGLANSPTAAVEAGPMSCTITDSVLGEVGAFEFPQGGRPQ